MSAPSTERDELTGQEAATPADDVVAIDRAESEDLRAIARSSASSKPPTREDVDPERGAESELGGRGEEVLHRELAARDRRLSDLESSYRRAIGDRELATALTGKALVPGAASQLIKLWRDELDVYEESGEYRVAARDGRTLDLWVADRLGGPDYAHFCLPTTRGGVKAKGLSQTTATDGRPTGARTLGEAVVAQWRESSALRDGSRGGPIGLGRR